MAGSEADFAPVQYSTQDLPARDRIPMFREVFGRQIVRLDIEPQGDRPFRAEATLRRLPGVRLAFWNTSGLRLARTRDLIPDNDDAICLVMHLGKDINASARGRRMTLTGGDAVPLHTMEPAETAYTAKTRLTSLTVPRAALASLVGGLQDAILRPIPADSEALRLLRTYLQAMSKDPPFATPELRRLAVTHIHDLMALALGATGDEAALAKTRGLPAAQFEAIKADITANLTRRDLSLHFISGRQQLSPRHIRRLFKAEGTTFSDFVLEQRLARARRMLADPRYGEWTISAIAYAAGFGDLSYFNRAFRNRFGITPGEARNANGTEH